MAVDKPVNLYEASLVSSHGVVPVRGRRHRQVLLIHGAANSAVVWRFWQQHLAGHGFASHAIDLRGHGSSNAASIASTSMSDYAADVRALIEVLAEPPVVVGWSMGGLVAMMVAQEGLASAVVALEPSEPAAGTNAQVLLRTGEFGGEEYGLSDKASVACVAPELDAEERELVWRSISRESRYARDERKRGVVIESLPVPALVIADPNRDDYRDRYKIVTRECLRLGVELWDVHTSSHWDQVLNRRWLTGVLPRFVNWLDRVDTPGQ